MQKLTRRCAQCRTQQQRDLMLRIRVTDDGAPTLLSRPSGRSLYLCPTVLCIERAIRNKAIPRLLPGLNPENWRNWCQNQLQRLQTAQKA